MIVTFNFNEDQAKEYTEYMEFLEYFANAPDYEEIFKAVYEKLGELISTVACNSYKLEKEET